MLNKTFKTENGLNAKILTDLRSVYPDSQYPYYGYVRFPDKKVLFGHWNYFGKSSISPSLSLVDFEPISYSENLIVRKIWVNVEGSMISEDEILELLELLQKDFNDMSLNDLKLLLNTLKRCKEFDGIDQLEQDLKNRISNISFDIIKAFQSVEFETDRTD